jgi:hypothetical protein
MSDCGGGEAGRDPSWHQASNMPALGVSCKGLHVLNYCDSLAAWTGPRVRGGVAHGLSAELGSFIHLPGVSWLLNVAVWWVRIPGELPLDVG